MTFVEIPYGAVEIKAVAEYDRMALSLRPGGDVSAERKRPAVFGLYEMLYGRIFAGGGA